eukprot:4694510-Alexandrium_andersonii.AAC.1
MSKCYFRSKRCCACTKFAARQRALPCNAGHALTDGHACAHALPRPSSAKVSEPTHEAAGQSAITRGIKRHEYPARPGPLHSNPPLPPWTPVAQQAHRTPLLVELGAQQREQQDWPCRHGTHALAAQLKQATRLM